MPLLLTEAIPKAVGAGEAAAARLVVMDAIDEPAADFYRHHGFITAPEHPLRLYRRIKDIRASLEAQNRPRPELSEGLPSKVARDARPEIAR